VLAVIDWSKKALASVVWRLRQEHALTQEQLAERADVAVEDVQELEQGVWSGCDMEVVYKIAGLFSVCPLELFKRAQVKAQEFEGVFHGTGG
jgi:DNA-binding XRE family transcriptional regulator